MKRVCCFFYCLAVVLSGWTLCAVGYYNQLLPDRFTVSRGQTVQVGDLVVSTSPGVERAVAASVGGQYRTTLSLMGVIPLKEVAVTVTEEKTVMVCGTPFGVKLYTDGVLVVSLSDVTTAVGQVNPAAAAGVQVGDTILAVNGERITTSRQLSQHIAGCEGKKITLRLRRDGVAFDAAFTPVRAGDGSGYKAGMWVRDSAAGVGTLTFYDPATGVFAGLGHPVCDVDTGQEMVLGSGEMVPARIFGVEKGRSGSPGELNGCFEPGSLGNLTRNGQDGVYGVLTTHPTAAESLPVARRQQVKEGAAEIWTTVEGTTPKRYAVEIEQVRYSGLASTRNLVVRVTDPELLAKTGGIVQGMSGSPIIQDGKLVGAVTHVLVDDPTRGYGIFAESMLDTAATVAEQKPHPNANKKSLWQSPQAFCYSSIPNNQSTDTFSSFANSRSS